MGPRSGQVINIPKIEIWLQQSKFRFEKKNQVDFATISRGFMVGETG